MGDLDVVPTGAMSGELAGFEKWAVAVGHLFNGKRGKDFQEQMLRRFSWVFIRAMFGRRMLVDGIDPLLTLEPERGVLLVSNHRSFFDQWVILAAFYSCGAPWAHHLYFPVRANFFYEHPFGLLLNIGTGAGVMYPPIFRQSDRTALNDDSLERIIKALERPGTVVGVHPEGTRGKGPDPYELLPAQPGVGKMALLAKPTVIPVFINGLSNDLAADIRRTYRPGIRRENPITVVCGAPIDYGELAAQKPRPTLYKKAADIFMAEIKKLGARERELRAAALRGDIPDDSRAWADNRSPYRFYAPPRPPEGSGG